MDWLALTFLPATFVTIAALLHASAVLEERLAHATVDSRNRRVRRTAAGAVNGNDALSTSPDA